MQRLLQKEMMERRDTREKEKSDWHREKEIQRQNIRLKYQQPRQNVVFTPAIRRPHLVYN